MTWITWKFYGVLVLCLERWKLLYYVACEWKFYWSNFFMEWKFLMWLNFSKYFGGHKILCVVLLLVRTFFFKCRKFIKIWNSNSIESNKISTQFWWLENEKFLSIFLCEILSKFDIKYQFVIFEVFSKYNHIQIPPSSTLLYPEKPLIS